MQRRPRTIAFWQQRLPHWEVEGGRYFLTLHVAGAIPAAGRERLRRMARQLAACDVRHTPRWLRIHRMVFREIERWLDRAVAGAWLAHPDVAAAIIEAICDRSRRCQWQVFEYVVMPTHLHLFCELGSQGLKCSLEDFKRWTGQRAAKILGHGGRRFWQREWFDHWSRSDEQDERIVAYIRNNPVKAHLVERYTDWPYGSWSCTRPG